MTAARPAPTPTPYQHAIAKARSTAGALTQAAAARVQKSIEQYAAELEAKLGALSAVGSSKAPAIAKSLEITKAANAKLQAALVAAVKDNRDVAFTDVLDVWKQASAEVVKAAGDIPNALLGAIQTPNILMAGRFEALGGVSYLKSLTASAKDGADEVSAILRTGLTANIGPQELARRLRPYVAGAEAFEAAFPKKDERFAVLHDLRNSKLSPELRNAAFKVRSNSLRIAYSEIHNARAEAELQAFAVDPIIVGVRWTLSPFRGSLGSPDICDAYARNNWFDLGVGVFPLDSVPMPPHPHDKCERMPVPRPPKEWHEPKPTKVKRVLSVKDAHVSGAPTAIKQTPAQAAAVRKQLSQQFAVLDSSPSSAAMQKLIAQGEAAGADLAAELVAAQTVTAAIEAAVADAAVSALPPTVIGDVTFPVHLEGDAYDAAKKLVYKASHNRSTTAIKALKDMGADTSVLEEKHAAKIAKLKEQAAAKKAAKDAEKQAATAPIVEAPAPLPPEPVPVAKPAPIEPVPVPVAPTPAPTVTIPANPLAGKSVEELQAIAKENKVYLITKKAIAADAEKFAALLNDAIAGDAKAIETLASEYGANVNGLKVKHGLKEFPPTPTVAPAPAPAPTVVEQLAPVVEATPAPIVTAAGTPAATASAENVLYQAGKALGGSNGAQVWVGKDGVARAVKVYKDASQAYGEALANDLYRRLGLGAPDALTFEHEGKVYYASTMIDGVTKANELGQLGLTATRARKVLDGFAADLLTANWDAPGLSLDNLVEIGGNIVRVDNGSAFLFRAQGTRKPVELLDKMTEWEGFAPGAANKNPQYAKLFETAGLKGPKELGQAFVEQVDRIIDVYDDVGGWKLYVEKMAPGMKAADRDRVVHMLESRFSALADKSLEVQKEVLTAAAKPAPVTVETVAKPVTPVSLQPAPAAVVQPVGTSVPFGASPKAQQLAQSIKLTQPIGAVKQAKKYGVYLNKSELSAANGSLNAFKKALVKAVDGDPAAIEQLKSLGASTQVLEQKLALQATTNTAAVPQTAGPLPGFGGATPHVPTSHVITPSEVPGVQAASKVPQPLYFQGGNTTTTAIKTSGIDFTKLPAGQVGFELEPAPTALKPTSKVYLQLHVVAKNPLTVSSSVTLDSYIEAITGKTVAAAKNLSAAEKRAALLSKGFDAVVQKNANGVVEKVIALNPDIVKVVDKAVPAELIPKPVAPVYTPTPAGGLASTEGSLAGRKPSTVSLEPKAGETKEQAKVRQFRQTFRANFTADERERLGQHAAATLQQGDEVAERLRTWRIEQLKKTLVDDHGFTPSQARKVQSAWDKAIRSWFGSSSSDGAGVMKLAAEDVHGIESTTFHGRYFDHNAAERKRWFSGAAEKHLATLGLTRDEARLVYEADTRINRAMMMEAFGVEEGQTFKVWRGVQESYFTAHHIAVPAVGSEMTVTMNSLSSFSAARPFGGVVLELEATLDDVALFYTQLNAGGFWNEREVWIIGRPRPMKRVR